MGIHGCTLQQFHNEGIRVIHTVGRQLAHLIDIGVSHHLVLESHSQHLVITQRLVQRNKTKFAVEGIFVGRQQSSTFHLFIVLA